MKHEMSRAVLAVVVVAVLCLAAGPALGVKTVSSSDGVSLTFTDSGAFSSMTVDGNTVPTLGGVSGGFFIFPLDGVQLPTNRHAFNAGTQITGTASMEGSNVRVTGTAQNESFNILLTGGLPYIKVDGTVTGTTQTDHVFLVDFRLPVNAQGWSFARDMVTSDTIDTGSSNWYDYLHYFQSGKHPSLSLNPYGSITKTTSPTMGLTLVPLMDPPQAYAIQYNGQGGFWIQFEMGTTPKTTKHPNTAEIHFVLYKHDPKWGNRSAVARYQSFFPEWFVRRYTGGNWIDDDDGPRSSIPTDISVKYLLTAGYADSISNNNGWYAMKYNEPWCAHTTWDSALDSVEEAAKDVPANDVFYDPAKGETAKTWAQALLLSGLQHPDGQYIGVDDPGLWNDNGRLYRWLCNPDPEIPNWRNFSIGVNRNNTVEDEEWYTQWGAGPDSSSDVYTGLYFDSTTGWWSGWGTVHNFNPNHWATYDFNPGYFPGDPPYNMYSGGKVCMWAPFSNVEMMKFAHERMLLEGRPLFTNTAPNYELFMVAPHQDAFAAAEGWQCTYTGGGHAGDWAIMRASVGKKPLSYLYRCGAGTIQTEAMVKNCLLFGVYPGVQWNFSAIHDLYTTYMPVLNQLDAAGWTPITGAVVNTTSGGAYVERFGPDSNGAQFLTVGGPQWTTNPAQGVVATVYSSDLGWSSNPNVTVTTLVGSAPTKSTDGNGNMTLDFGSVNAEDTRVVKLVYNGTPTMPVANFSANTTSGNAPLSVNFTDTSTQSPTSWLWSFGDGSVSLSQNPSHTFAAGRYTVSLTAKNSTGFDTKSKAEYITSGVVPVADFVARPRSGWDGMNNRLKVFFRDRSTNLPTSWSWSFGDGGTSNLRAPQHFYGQGTFTVALTVANASGSNTATKTNYITAAPRQKPATGFKASSTMGAPPLAVNFTDTSGYSPTSWAWSFGDGGTSNAQNPSHTYNSVGLYTVALTAANAYGSESLTKANYIGALNETIIYPTTISGNVVSGDLASLQADDDNYLTVSGLNLGLYNDTGMSGAPYWGIKYEVVGHAANSGYTSFFIWAFSAGNWYNHLYSFVTDSTAPTTDKLYTWAHTPAAPFFDIRHDQGLDYDGRVGVKICACGNSGNYLVDMVRIHLYARPGASPAPVANFTGNPVSGPAPLAVAFTDFSTNSPTAWSWTFGDGNSSASQNPSHTYNSAGSYTVGLTATNAAGSNTNTKSNYVTVSSGGGAPVANFSGTPLSGAAPLAVSFTDTSTNTPTAWSWTFGDSSSSTVQNPSHTYTSNGSYTVTLTATNASGSDGETKTSYITVSTAGNPPVANFSGTPTSGNAPLAVTFTDSSTNTPTSWSWNFGDTGSSTAQSPSHTYTTVGSYTVTLTAGNAYGSDGETKTDYITATSGGGSTVFYPTATTNGGGMTAVSGTLSNLQANDDAYLVTASSSGGGGTVIYQFTTGYNQSQVSRMTFDVVVKSSLSNDPDVAGLCSWYSGDGYEWVVGYNYLGTSEHTFTWSTTNISGYFPSNGNPSLKMCYCSGGPAYQLSTDLVKCTLELVGGAAPVANFSGTPTSGTVPLTVNFTDSSTNTPTSWSWTFGDGGVSAAQNPSYIYTSTGTYSVTLTATNGSGSDGETKTNYITVNPAAPVANFTGTPTSGNAPLVVSFTDTSTNTPTAWSWTFGDSSTSTAQNPSHTYTSSGFYTVALTASNAGGSDGETKTNYITVNPTAPVANFTGTPTTGNAPLAVSFTDTSTNTPTAWSWTFGDSSSSTAQNPSHTYTGAGNYTVTLTATNAGGSDGETKTNYISASAPAPVANFTGTPTSGTAPLAVSFTDTSTNSPTSWSWVFGDGSTSTAHNPSHTYNSTGSYTVTLTATNASGSDGETKANYINANPAAPVANFTGTPTTGAAPLTVNFTDTSTNGPTSWSWSFGYNGGSSGVQNPIYTYTVAGTYTVTLTATNAGGSDGETKTNYITVNPAAPVADFTGSPVTGTAPLAVSFTDTSTNAPTSWSWTFGDSNTSTAQNPSHSYTSTGAYTVALTATNATGSNTNTKNNYITVSSSSGTVFYPTAATNGGGVTTVSGSISNLQADDDSYMVSSATSSGTVTYEFTTSYTPSQVSRMTFDVKAKSNLGGGLQALLCCWYVEDGYEYEVGTSYLGTSEFTFSWSTTNMSRYFPSNGHPLIRMCYCSGGPAFQISADLVKMTLEVAGGGAPVANFSGTPTSGNAPLAVSFTDNSSNTPTSWSWTFGDSTTSTVQNPSHAYTSSGSYTVALTATNASGSNTNTKTNYITVTPPAPVANFSGTPTSGTAPLAVSFTDSSTNMPTSWSWTFGDGGTSVSQNPSHTYSTAGTYTVALTATNAGGSNTNTKSNYITVNPSGAAPVANFTGTPTSGTVPLTVNFTDSSTNTPTSWSWAFGDGGTAVVKNPGHAYSSPGSYTVTLTATNAYGSDGETKTNYITASAVTPVANFSGTPTSGTAPLAVSFTDSSTNTPTSWSWTFGDGGTSVSQNPSHTYNTTGSYTVTLTATNSAGSDGETKTDYITVSSSSPTVFYPTSATNGGGMTTVSGTIGDLQADDNVYMVSASSGGGGGTVTYFFTTGYSQSQVSSMTFDVTVKSSLSNDPDTAGLCSWYSDDGYEWVNGYNSLGTSEHTFHWSTTNISKYFPSNGDPSLKMCYCSGGPTYQISTDLVKCTLELVGGGGPAPAADFTGTPTNGNAPLAVSFTDSSTNSPTSWSWTFGDGNSSTSQNPSHTYNSAGAYTVALTATNSGGSNTKTRTDYISAFVGAPTFVAAGTVASGTGTITPALPSGIASNDILLLFVETANQASSITNQNGGTWTQVTGSPQSYGTAAASDAVRLTVFWSRYNGSQGNPTVSDSGNHQLGRIIAIRGATTSGDPCDITAGGTESTVDTSGSVPGATTTVANCLAVAAVATSLPDASGTANFSSWSNADLSSVTERTDNTVTAGNGGGLAVATGGKATAGAYGSTAVTCGTATTKAMMSIAIKP